MIVPIVPVSDGDPSHRPANSSYVAADDSIYLEKIATLWMKEKGEYAHGLSYKLDRLPAGYAVFGRPRQTDPKTFDRWLFGHPNHSYFDSPNRFYPHFLHLMNNNGSNVGCPCTVCAKKGGKIPKMGASKPQPPKGKAEVKSLPVGKPRGRPAQTGKLDDEGTPDIYRNFLNKLKVSRVVDEPVEEKYSLDWRVERELLPEMLRKTSGQPAWVPRMAEIVLFVRDLSEHEEVCYDDSEGDFKLFSTTRREFVGRPKWEAGVVTQVAAENITIDDLVLGSEKRKGINYSGYRVEPVPDPNNPESKHLSRRYKYVPLHHTRPFAFWRELHTNIPQQDWHQTVTNALAVSSSFSLVEKYHFKGSWPKASVLCQGIYLGAELLLVGDVVRVIPPCESLQDTVTDIVQIKNIKLEFNNLDVASDNDKDEGHPYNSSVTITGKCYTTDQTRAVSNTPMDQNSLNTRLYNVSSDYMCLYPRQHSSQITQFPFNRILGRCFEADAMLLWFPSEHIPSFSAGLRGVKRARKYAQQTDKRIVARESKKWFWAETRTEALDLETVNGVDVGKKDNTRQPRKWMQHIRVLDGTIGAEEKSKLTGQAAAAAASSTARRHAFGKFMYGSESAKSVADSEAESTSRKRSVSVAGLDQDDSTIRSKMKKKTEGKESQSHSEEDDDFDDFLDGITQGRISIPDTYENDDVIMISD